MPMTASSLKTRIKDKIIAQFGSADDASHLDKYAEAIADAVIDEIAANGTVTVASVTAVSPGAGVSGPGVGTVDTA